jgi:hypothetical protein
MPHKAAAVSAESPDWTAMIALIMLASTSLIHGINTPCTAKWGVSGRRAFIWAGDNARVDCP